MLKPVLGGLIKPTNHIMESNKSQVLLKAGDRVLTSKGKIGTIEIAPRIEIGYYKPKKFNTPGDWKKLEVFPIDKIEEATNKMKDCWAWSYPNEEIVLEIVHSALVKIGHNLYPIHPAQLTKMDSLFPVRVVYSGDSTGMSQDQECTVYLPKDFCIYCLHDNRHENSDSFIKRIYPFVQAVTGIRDSEWLSILKVYAI